MRIIERYIMGKHSDDTCEDGIVTTVNHVAVIDGSTSKTPERVNSGMQNGRFAMQLVSDVISSLPAQTTMLQFCRIVTDAIDDAYNYYQQDPDIIQQHPERRLTCSAAVYSRYHREVWLVGDCQCIVEGKYYDNAKPDEAANAEKRSRYIKEHKLSVEEVRRHDEGRDQIINDIIASMHSQNKTYAVIDGTPIYIKGVKVIAVPVDSEVVLATDGYPFLCNTLAESEQRLSQLLVDDPLLINQFKATKAYMEGNSSFDDRAYVRFKA
jgi:glycerophosphoryl diester phosphodiesterase